MKKGNPRVIHTLCSSYLNEVVPVDAGTSQIKETRLAFMSGAIAAYGTILHHMDDSNSEDVIMKKLEFLNEEFEAFKVEMGVYKEDDNA